VSRWEYFGESWKGDDYSDDPSKIGPDVRQWFTLLVSKTLKRQVGADGEDNAIVQCRLIVESHLKGDEQAVIDWLTSRIDRFTIFVPLAEYRGDNYAMGGWQVRWNAIHRVIADVCCEIVEAKRVARDAARYPTLDDWLRADIAGTLRHRGADGGMGKVPGKVRGRLKREASARRLALLRSTAIVCACGASFTPDRANATRCDKCRDLARTAKAMRRPAR
jgi:hypothetical protein